MKFLVVLFALLAAVFCAEHCYNNAVNICAGKGGGMLNCTAKYGGAHNVSFDLQSYANDHIAHSFDYLLMSTHFGNYMKSREGFEKLFRKLSDDTWNDAIDLIKYITKRGEKMNFSARKTISKDKPKAKTFELDELAALALGLDKQKKLAEEAHTIHGLVSRHGGSRDPEVSSYLEEHFMHRHSESIRKLSGHTNDVTRFLAINDQAGLSLFLFDEYLQKTE